jgi:LemA protein
MSTAETPIAAPKMLTLVLVMLSLSLSGCGYRTLQANDEQVKASASGVVHQYLRCAELMPSLMNSVKTQG